MFSRTLQLGAKSWLNCNEEGSSLSGTEKNGLVTGRNPLLNLDFPDVDVIRVGEVYYMVSTTMYFLPGGVILRSYDLIHWEYAARIYDELEDNEGWRLEDGKGVYSSGMWAASLRYHEGIFYVCFVANDTHRTYLYRAQRIEGPWKRNYIEGFYPDCSLLFDDDGRTYIAYGHRVIYLTELNEELTAPKKNGLHRVLADYGASRQLPYEGTHIYHLNGRYYLFLIHSLREEWRRVETCLVSDSLEGPFTGGIVFNDDLGFFNQGIAQGGIVDTPDGDWYAILFQDRGACGRIPVLLPVKWESGLPVLGKDGRAPLTVESRSTRPDYSYAPLIDSDAFDGDRLKDVWEWNHLPDPNRWAMAGGRLMLTTGKVEGDLTLVRNILTQRALFPACSAHVTIDGSRLRPGDVAGLCILQYHWAYIGIKRLQEGYELIVCMREKEEAEVKAVIPWRESRATVRVSMDFRELRDQAAFFYRGEDGWIPLGGMHQMKYLLKHFTGNRFGLFALAQETGGGTAVFERFVYEKGMDAASI